MHADVWWYEGRKQWCADVPSQQGRRRLYLGATEAKAHAELHRYMAAYYEELGEQPPDSRIPARGGSNGLLLLELAVRFLNWNKANRAPGTWHGYRDGLKHITRRHRDKFTGELTATDVEDVKEEMIEAGYAARTVNIMVTAVKRMYNWARKQGLVAENQLAGVEHVSPHVNAPEDPPERHMSLERASECIALCRGSQPLGDICELLLLTGMRVGEVVKLRWRDVDLGERMVRLERHKTSAYARGRPRTIPLCERAVEILSAHAPGDGEADRHVFLGRNGQPFSVGVLHNRLRRLRRRHPELRGFTFHKMRHTCATHLARLKVPERVAQAVLGHSSTLMTRYYTATDKDEMIEAVEKLSDAAQAEERLQTAAR